MKKLVFAFFLLSFTVVAFGQMEWEIRSPYPTTNQLKGDFFLSDQTGWVVGFNGTILHTTDGGTHWDLQHSNNTESMWNIFFVDEHEGWAVGWSDIYHTTDAGQHWEKQVKPGWPGDMTDVYFINHDTGWIVGTYKIVFKTTDGGEHWNRIMSNINQDKGFYSVAFTDELHGCAVGGTLPGDNIGYIMVTNDGGLTWTETTPEENSKYNKITFLDADTGWVCGENGTLLKTTDGGYTWTHHDIGYYSFKGVHFFDHQRGVVLSRASIIRTNDGGETWGDPIDIDHNYFSTLRAFASGADNHLVAVGFDGLITKSIDGGQTWEKMSKGLTQNIKQIGFFNDTEGYAITNLTVATGGVMHTLDKGISWTVDTLNAYNRIYRMQVVDANTCFFLRVDGKIVKSVDAGVSWSNSDVPNLSMRYADMQFVNNQVGYLCDDSSILVKTIDGGTSWSQVSFEQDYNFTNLFFLDENKGWVIDYDGKQILRTVDGGDTWQFSTVGEDGVIYQPVDVFFLNENEGYVSTKEGVLFKSTNGGNSWDKLYAFDEESYLGKVHFVSDQEGWYLSQKTAWHTIDGGLTWYSSQFDVFLNDLYFLNDHQGWLAGNTGLVAWYSFVGIDEVNKSNDDILSISPNPATDVITVSLSNKSERLLSLEVYNMLGRRVINIEGLSISGSYKLDINKLQPGTYIVKVSTPSDKRLAKFVVQ